MKFTILHSFHDHIGSIILKLTEGTHDNVIAGYNNSEPFTTLSDVRWMRESLGYIFLYLLKTKYFVLNKIFKKFLKNGYDIILPQNPKYISLNHIFVKKSTHIDHAHQ